MSKDVILCAFNCSKTSPCSEWAEQLFGSPPAIVAIEGGSSTSFKEAADRFTYNPFGWLRARMIDSGGRLAIATFSAGWGFVDAVMRNQQARELVDSVILLDGLHCQVGTLDPWIQYAKRAALGGETMPLLMMLHSTIIPPYTSAQQTNKAVFIGGVETCPAPAESIEHEVLTRAKLEAPITIKSAYGSRTWKTDPLATWEGAGNLYRYEYNGNDAPTHIYIAKVVQPRAWTVLAQRWNKGGGVTECCDLTGSGRVE